MGAGVRITSHAVCRYQERVDRNITVLEAGLRLQRLVSMGRARATPRHWMRDSVGATPGLRFVYWSGEPNVCALLREGAVVTVLTRALCKSSRPRHLQLVGRPARPAADEVARWCWNGERDALDDAA